MGQKLAQSELILIFGIQWSMILCALVYTRKSSAQSEINNLNTESEWAEVSRNSTFPKRVDGLWKVGANISGDGGIENTVTNAASIGSVMHRLFPCYQNL